jgi:pimeloyl-ACP methyl ester carboxylesterase
VNMVFLGDTRATPPPDQCQLTKRRPGSPMPPESNASLGPGRPWSSSGVGRAPTLVMHGSLDLVEPGGAREWTRPLMAPGVVAGQRGHLPFLEAAERCSMLLGRSSPNSGAGGVQETGQTGKRANERATC